MAKNIKVTLTLDDSQYRRKIKNANNDLKSIGGTNNTLLAGFARLGPAIAAAFSIGAIINFGQQIRSATVEIENIRNQLTLVAGSADELNRIMTLLTATAVQNRTSFAATAELFTKLKVATDELGRSEDEVILVTSKLSQALQVAGADAATTNSVVRQFGQAMASGTVRGDEFNSLVEGLGPALAIMAKETGVGVGELRKMSQAGELTADVLFDMILNSNTLTAAFKEMNVTTEQLETALGDAFNRFLVRAGEATGITNIYKEAVKALTRELNILSGAEGTIDKLSLAEIVEDVESGKIQVVDAVDELEARLRDLTSQVSFVGRAADASGLESLKRTLEEIGETEQEGLLGLVYSMEQIGKGEEFIKGLIDQLNNLAETRKTQAEELKKQTDAENAHQKVLDGILAGVAEQIKLGKEFAKGDYRTELEKINDRIATAKNTMDSLREAFLAYHEANDGGIPTLQDYENFLKEQGFTLDDLINEYGAATMALQEYNDKLNEGSDELQGYDKFMFDLLEKMVEFHEQQEFIKQGLDEVEKSFAAGAITIEQYNYLIDALNEMLEKGKSEAELYREQLENIRNSMEEVDGLEQFLLMQERLNELHRTGAITLDDYNRLMKELMNTFTEADEVAGIVIRSIEDLSRGFSDDLANAIMNGESLMDGMKDTFKRVVTQMIADAMRLNIIQPLLSSIFGGSFGPGGSYTPGGGGMFGFVKGLFGFQHGGQTHAGRPYLVGERGPELFVPDRAGDVVPNHAMGQPVTYNINAVDAKSFKQLVAEDPEFIFGVTQAGARRLPS